MSAPEAQSATADFVAPTHDELALHAITYFERVKYPPGDPQRTYDEILKALDDPRLDRPRECSYARDYGYMDGNVKSCVIGVVLLNAGVPTWYLQKQYGSCYLESISFLLIRFGLDVEMCKYAQTLFDRAVYVETIRRSLAREYPQYAKVADGEN